MKITCLPNGPMLVNDVEVFEGRVLRASGTAALCRCGQSANKPFCDGAHKQTGFEAEAIELVLEFPDVSEDNEQ